MPHDLPLSTPLVDERPAEPFWRTKRLAEMSAAEWESLCDGCGLCCLVRFEDEDSGEVIPTRVHCKLFDPQTCACSDYVNRKAHVPDCIKLTPGNIEALEWMPKSCGYRRIHEGRDLADWHPLVSGDAESVHRAGVSVRGQTISEETLREPEDALDYEAPEYMVERGVRPIRSDKQAGRR
ncbi:MAG: YcgN family cysteine cluster protein [Brevundimonas sp.]|nr:MAG: YcgN family cysteine cluster protein [Brevundimonas sp.]